MARLPSHLISFHLQDGDRRIIAALTALQLTHQNAQLAAHILRLVLFPRPFQDLLGMDAVAEHDDLIPLLQLQTQTVWLDLFHDADGQRSSAQPDQLAAAQQQRRTGSGLHQICAALMRIDADGSTT